MLGRGIFPVERVEQTQPEVLNPIVHLKEAMGLQDDNVIDYGFHVCCTLLFQFGQQAFDFGGQSLPSRWAAASRRSSPVVSELADQPLGGG